MNLRKLQSLSGETRVARNDVYARFVQGEQKKTQEKDTSSRSGDDSVELRQTTTPAPGEADWDWLARAKSELNTQPTPETPAPPRRNVSTPAPNGSPTTGAPLATPALPLSEKDDDWNWLAQAANPETEPPSASASTSSSSSSPSTTTTAPQPGRHDPDTESWGNQNWSRSYFTQDGTAENYGIENYMDQLMHRDEEYYRADQWQWVNQRMDGLEDTINNGPTQLGNLQTQQASLNNERTSLMSEYNANLGTIDSLQDRVNSLNSEIASLKRGGNDREIQDKLEEVKRLKKEIYEMEKKQERDQAKADRLQQALDNNEPTYGEPYPQETIRRIRNETWDGSEVIRLKYEDLEMAQYDYNTAVRYGGDNQEGKRRELTGEIADLQQQMYRLQVRQNQIEQRIDAIDYELGQVSQQIWDKQNQLLKAKEEWWVREHQRNEKGFSRV